MYETNCVMCTIGHFLGTDSYGAANAVSGMDGPRYEKHEISELLAKANLASGLGCYEFDSLNAANRFMTANPGDFAFGMSWGGGAHLITASTSGGMVEYYDAQNGSTSAPDEGHRYHLWPVFRR